MSLGSDDTRIVLAVDRRHCGDRFLQLVCRRDACLILRGAFFIFFHSLSVGILIIRNGVLRFFDLSFGVGDFLFVFRSFFREFGFAVRDFLLGVFQLFLGFLQLDFCVVQLEPGVGNLRIIAGLRVGKLGFRAFQLFLGIRFNFLQADKGPSAQSLFNLLGQRIRERFVF